MSPDTAINIIPFHGPSLEHPHQLKATHAATLLSQYYYLICRNNLAFMHNMAYNDCVAQPRAPRAGLKGKMTMTTPDGYRIHANPRVKLKNDESALARCIQLRQSFNISKGRDGYDSKPIGNFYGYHRPGYGDYVVMSGLSVAARFRFDPERSVWTVHFVESGDTRTTKHQLYIASAIEGLGYARN